MSACALAPAAPASGAIGVVDEWGGSGTGDGEFSAPNGVAVSPSGDVYVADSELNRVQRFDSSGNFIGKWGTGGTAEGEFDFPVGIAVGAAGDVYVADVANQRIQQFTAGGTFVRTWGNDVGGAGDNTCAAGEGCQAGAAGNGDGEFQEPVGVATDSLGSVYVTDGNNDRIQKFTSAGGFTTKWGSTGTANGQFDGPSDIAVDSGLNVYTSESSPATSHRVQKFETSGGHLWSQELPGVSIGGLAAGSNGEVFATQIFFNKITRYRATDGAVLGTFADGLLDDPLGIAVDASGNLYVANNGSDRIVKLGEVGGGGSGGGSGSTGGGGGAGAGTRTTTTSLACNRGANPGSPWSCHVGVFDVAGNGFTAASGSVAIESSGGGSISSPTCPLGPSQLAPNRADCQFTFTQDRLIGTTIRASYGGDATHGGSAASFQIHGYGDFLVCGPAPLPPCPGNSNPVQVCVSIWTLDCEGRFPRPDPVETCVSLWQNCNGFGGSQQGRPGQIDLGGLPGQIGTRAGCGGNANRQWVSTDVCDRMKAYIAATGRWTERNEYDAAFARYKALVDAARPGSSARLGPLSVSNIGEYLNAAFALARFDDEAVGRRLKAAMEAEAMRKLDCMLGASGGTTDSLLARCEHGFDWTLDFCNRSMVLPGDDSADATLPGPLGVVLGEEDDRICRHVQLLYQAGAGTTLQWLARERKELGVLKPFGQSRSATKGPLAKRKGAKTYIPLYQGELSLDSGENGKLKLRLVKGAKKTLRKMQRSGVRRIKGIGMTTAEPMPGLEPEIKRVPLRIDLG